MATLTRLDQVQCTETLRHEGDLITAGDEIRVISNCTLEITGGIYVRDNATLRLENVNVRFVDTDDELRHTFVVSEGSTANLVNTRCNVGVELYGSSSLTAYGSRLIASYYCMVHGYNHTYGGVYACDSSNAKIIDCTLGDVSVLDNSKAEVAGSDIYSLRLNHMDVIVSNSTVEILRNDVKRQSGIIVITLEDLSSIDLASVLPGSKTILRNVVVEGVWLNIYDSNVTIRGSKLLYIIAYNTTRLSLVNSSLSGLYFNGESGTASVENCTIDRVQNSGFASNFTINVRRSWIREMDLDFSSICLDVSESTIDSLSTYNLWAPSDDLCLNDSVIGSLNLGFGWQTPIHYRFKGVTIRDAISFKYGVSGDSGGAVITGTVRFGPDFRINKTTVDRYALITRMYDVMVTEEYEPKDGVKLTLLKGNQTLWACETDEAGKATFPVRYARIFVVIPPTTPMTPTVIQVNNVTETLALRVGEGRSSVEIEVGLATDTPIMVNLTRNYVYGLYALPTILVAIVLYLVKIVRERPTI